MELQGKVAVVTGGASGIGKALCEAFAAEGARVVVSDLNGDGAAAVATAVDGLAVTTDVSEEADVVALADAAEDHFGAVDLFFSNAGIAVGGGVEVADEGWQRSWEVNVMAHVYAARTMIPRWIERGGGYLASTASAAGLLTNLGVGPYSVTKHAAVALAEWLAITHAHQGIKVSCLCPQGVRTPMLMGGVGQEGANAVLSSGGMLEPADVAAAVVAGLRDERFLILPHPEVAEYMQRRAGDHERWLAGMQRLQGRLNDASA